MWKGRFSADTAPTVRDYTESISFDWRLYRHDIEGSVAHAAALERAGILTPDERAHIESGLHAIREEIAAGQFVFRPELEDIHMNIEAELTRRIGPAGAKLHTARSRNDQVALDLRLYLREEIARILDALRALQRSLVGLAARHPGAILPGYTHLQRAQPVLFAHHLLAYVEMLDRDVGRFVDGRARLNVLPLGSGAIAGSTIVLDREFIARQLGFDTLSRNSMDAVSDRDFAAEFLAAAALSGVHLSRLGEDVVLWASAEFGFVTVADAYATGSSLMPQKKNPDIAELARGKSGRLCGNLMSLLVTLKGLPMTYNRDLQEDKEAVFDSADTLLATLGVMAGMMDTLTLREGPAAAAAADPMLLATDLADHLVLRGVPFRQAHEAVGRLVAKSVESGISIDRLPPEAYAECSPDFGPDAKHVFDLHRALAARQAPGAPSPENVRAQLAFWEERLRG